MRRICPQSMSYGMIPEKLNNDKRNGHNKAKFQSPQDLEETNMMIQVKSSF
jgi:hypothetical protein